MAAGLLTDVDRARLHVLDRLACVRLVDMGKNSGGRVYGRVLDVVGEGLQPKRLRVECGSLELAGTVLHPCQYRFLYWADEEED
jgi:hypothetical protein